MPSLSALPGKEIANVADKSFPDAAVETDANTFAGNSDAARPGGGIADAPVDGFGKAVPRSVNRWRCAICRVDRLELRIVRRLASMTRYRPVASATLAVNLLGNGWIYVPIAIGILLSHRADARAIVAAAVLATVAAHALYALIKRTVARRRPFERDPGLRPLAPALDRYSFPSGHCMTLTAVSVPIVRAMPAFWPLALVALCLLAWCRLAAAHHYPSDVLAGICLGAAVAAPFTAWLVQA
jgi:undecaprenyl-diphosphatase